LRFHIVSKPSSEYEHGYWTLRINNKENSNNRNQFLCRLRGITLRDSKVSIQGIYLQLIKLTAVITTKEVKK
jgi:hypothetical protein